MKALRVCSCSNERRDWIFLSMSTYASVEKHLSLCVKGEIYAHLLGGIYNAGS